MTNKTKYRTQYEIKEQINRSMCLPNHIVEKLIIYIETIDRLPEGDLKEQLQNYCSDLIDRYQDTVGYF